MKVFITSNNTTKMYEENELNMILRVEKINELRKYYENKIDKLFENEKNEEEFERKFNILNEEFKYEFNNINNKYNNIIKNDK